MSILVTGAAGFIGSNFVLDWMSQSTEEIVSFDLLTYAGNLQNLSSIHKSFNHKFIKGNINDRALVKKILFDHQIRAVINFAAESHVDRSIHSPQDFIETNINGTFNLLESAREFWLGLEGKLKKDFRFLHISTDEVYGSLGTNEPAFSEKNRYVPNSPYSASKAASDHLVRAWYKTYGFPVLTTNCSNNYGPYQFPEKLIPLCILNALNNKPLPIYGDGMQVRDWLYVKDHCRALRVVLNKGSIGENYNIGGWNEQTNLDTVLLICSILDELMPRENGKKYKEQMTFIKDRPGHDKRYAINAGKIEQDLAWKPEESIQTGFRKTVLWYLDNLDWVENISSGEYQNWLKKHYS